MKKIVPAIIAICVLACVFLLSESPEPVRRPAESPTAKVGDLTLAEAYDRQLSDVQVEGEGVVKKVLPDDNEGSRHQRFLVELSSGQTILIAHNIDLALRVSPLNKGDTVRFYGEYEWNDKGGVVHWTHRDPDGRHPAGWIRRAGNDVENGDSPVIRPAPRRSRGKSKNVAD